MVPGGLISSCHRQPFEVNTDHLCVDVTGLPVVDLSLGRPREANFPTKLLPRVFFRPSCAINYKISPRQTLLHFTSFATNRRFRLTPGVLG